MTRSFGWVAGVRVRAELAQHAHFLWWQFLLEDPLMHELEAGLESFPDRRVVLDEEGLQVGTGVVLVTLVPVQEPHHR